MEISMSRAGFVRHLNEFKKKGKGEADAGGYAETV